MAHKHKWENVMLVWSSDPKDDLHIEICGGCKTIRVKYNTGRRKYIHKPKE